MICLTGDLHHMGLKTGNQAHAEKSEIKIAQEYLAMLEEAEVNVTFFVTGKAFKDEWEDLKPICDSKYTEIGGHNYYAFKPEIWHRFWNKLIKNYNGPHWYQKWEVAKTIRIIQEKTGRKIKIWRNHMYMHGPKTEKVLAELGIRICSDGVQKNSNGLQKHSSGIYNFPLNIIPDHEHIYHAERTPKWVQKWQKRYNWSDDFGPDSFYIKDWTEIVLSNLEENEKNGVISNIIIHPITMYLSDEFKSFQKILGFLKKRKTVFMSNLLPEEEK
ncbi:MAG: polysaccharide deacetylase family protein [Candidatus Cloacimonadota bacterium]|nr:polysaccharide deacetylase family protein [Candidatus Cloacimonadota bacterium]